MNPTPQLTWSQRLIRFIIFTLVRLFYPRIEVQDIENVPTSGPAIYVLNHPNSLFDPMVLMLGLKRPVAFLAKSTLFGNPIGKESDLRRIVVITFQAFEAWTREQGMERGKDETPSEFITRVAKSVPQMSTPASQVVDAYNRIVYGRGKATKSDLNAADKVWKAMLAR